MTSDFEAGYMDHGYQRRYRKLVFAEKMRSQPSRPEALFWEQRQLMRPHRIARQQVLLGYIADFAVTSARTIIEIDGRQHEGQAAYDTRRDDAFRDRGYAVLRIEAGLVFRSPRLAAQIACFFVDDIVDRRKETGTRYAVSGEIDRRGILSIFGGFQRIEQWHCYDLENGEWDFHRADESWVDCPTVGSHGATA